MAIFSDQVIFISGGSRGIGKAIALKLASLGANICIGAKTMDSHPTLPGSVNQTVKEIEALGAKAIGVELDIRDQEQIEAAVSSCVERFGKLDKLINNASAISLTNTLATTSKKYDLMHQVNGRGTYLLSRCCLPHLLKSNNAHILNLSPPLNLSPKWFANHTAYTMSKYQMSMCTLGMAAEFIKEPISINSLWPFTVIDTDALRMIPGLQPEQLRNTAIMADAAVEVLLQPAGKMRGEFLIDEDILRKAGVTDFDQYAVAPGGQLLKDLFLD